MFVILTRILFLLLVAAIIFKAWEILGSKNNGLINRLLFILVLYLLGPNESLIPEYLGQKIAEGMRQRLMGERF